MVNLKRGVILFALSFILPIIVGTIFKILYQDPDRYYYKFMISIYISMSILLVLALKSFPYIIYEMYSFQTDFHKKYNTQNKHVGKNLEELANKENLNIVHKVIKIFTILLSYIMLYGLWFDGKF